MYTRGEMAFRIGLFYTSASLSGSFGGSLSPLPIPPFHSNPNITLGLLARGLHEIGTRGGLTGWRWIFIIEGLLTVVVGFTAYFILPNNLHTAGCLSPEERIFAQQRLLNDRPTGLGHNSRLAASWDPVRRINTDGLQGTRTRTRTRALRMVRSPQRYLQHPTLAYCDCVFRHPSRAVLFWPVCQYSVTIILPLYFVLMT